MPDKKRYMITAALLYANGPVHIGHVAGCYLPADIYARYLRARGKEVCFVSGTDEHGVPITLKAQQQNKSPQEVVDYYYEHIKTTLARFDISFDMFDRTSQPMHHALSQDFFTRLYDKGFLEPRRTIQYYDTDNACFLPDRYIQGQCPYCDYLAAYGDQCEQCGRALSVKELKDPRSCFGGALAERKTLNWYLPMDKWQSHLQTYIESQAPTRSHVRGQCMSWLKEGLMARAMTRDLNWGVKVPLKNATGKVLYVWFEAPIGYISATKRLHPRTWTQYWQHKDTRLIHFIGKDNIVFHCLIFPLMLMMHGDYILPAAVPANEFLNLEGEKISTSREWAVWLHEYLDDFPNEKDTLRYVLCAKMPENKDSNFSWKEFKTLHNSELVAIYGNFVNRALVLVHEYFEGRVPEPVLPMPHASEACLREADAIQRQIEAHIERFAFRDALVALMELPRLGHRFLAEAKPWNAWPKNPKQVATQIYVVCQLLARMALISEPFLPNTTIKLRKLLKWHPNHEEAGKDTWQNVPTLKPLHSLEKPKLLFSKMEDKRIQAQIQKLKKKKLSPSIQTKSTMSNTTNTHNDAISFDDWLRLDLRVGTVRACEPVPKSNKLLQFTIDDGSETPRVIVSGIAHQYTPESLLDQQVIFIANLEARKIMGVQSHGMLLTAVSEDSKLSLLCTDKTMPNGAKIG